MEMPVRRFMSGVAGDLNAVALSPSSAGSVLLSSVSRVSIITSCLSSGIIHIGSKGQRGQASR